MCKRSTVYIFFASERRETTTRFSDMVLNLANTLQLQMSASHCCKILSDGKAPCNELMLHHTRQCAGARCKMLQMLRGLGLYTDAFTQRCFHKDMFLHRHLHIHMRLPRDGFTQTPSRTGVLHRDAFTKKNTHTHVRVLLNTDAFTLRCCWGMLLHARAFTQGFFWHKVAFTHRNFYSKYYYAEIFFHTEIYICTRMFF